MLPDSKGLAPQCFTIEEFCASHRIGRSMYFKLRKEGRGPHTFRIGDKVLISRESAERWRADRDAEAEKEPI